MNSDVILEKNTDLDCLTSSYSRPVYGYKSSQHPEIVSTSNAMAALPNSSNLFSSVHAPAQMDKILGSNTHTYIQSGMNDYASKLNAGMNFGWILA